MRKSFLVGSASLLAIATPGWAQTTPAPAATPPPPAADAQDEIVVTGIRASLQKAHRDQARCPTTMSTRSPPRISASCPTRTSPTPLQRLPGVNTSSAASGEGGFDENDRVSIRGTSPSLTQVTDRRPCGLDRRLVHPRPVPDRRPQHQLHPAAGRDRQRRRRQQDPGRLAAGRRRRRLDRPADSAARSISGRHVACSRDRPRAPTTPRARRRSRRSTRCSAGATPTTPSAIIVQGFYEQRSLRRYGQETLGYSPITAGNADRRGDPVAGRRRRRRP